MKWYGSLENRLMENQQFVKEIKVGDGATEYYYSDSHAYEVVDVKDQKHIGIRRYDAKNKCAYANEWTLTSNENNPIENLVKRGNYWYEEYIIKYEDYKFYYEHVNGTVYNDSEIDKLIWLGNHGVDMEKLKEKGTIKKYVKRNISIGVANEYYDWSF